MKTITIKKDEYDLFLNFKNHFEKSLNVFSKKTENKNFNPKEFFGLAKYTKDEIDKDLEKTKKEWE